MRSIKLRKNRSNRGGTEQLSRTSNLGSVMKESNKKSVLKTVSWRILGSMDTLLIAFILTSQVKTALSISAVEVMSKTVLYYVHERLWSRVI